MALPQMANIFSRQSLRMPLLDRLTDQAPDAHQETPLTFPQQLRQLHRSVQRDLEDLLNTRARAGGWPSELKALDHSLVAYGLPDFSELNLASTEAREQLRLMIQDAIERWEPRLSAISVSLADSTEPMDRTLHFQVDALLHTEPDVTPIAFDTRFEPVKGGFVIPGAAGE